MIIETEYRDADGPPPLHFVDKLMKYLKLPYYVGLLTAAKYHGATHQTVFETQVFTTKPLPPILYGKHRLLFVTNKFTELLPKHALQTPHGDVLISTPESTLVDLVRYKNRAAGLSHVATVIQEMREQIKPKRLLLLAEIHNDTPLFQRVGFMLELFGKKNGAPLQQWLRRRPVQVIKLEPGGKTGTKNNAKWSININSQIEADDL